MQLMLSIWYHFSLTACNTCIQHIPLFDKQTDSRYKHRYK